MWGVNPDTTMHTTLVKNGHTAARTVQRVIVHGVRKLIGGSERAGYTTVHVVVVLIMATTTWVLAGADACKGMLGRATYRYDSVGQS